MPHPGSNPVCCGSSQRRASTCCGSRCSGARTWDKEVPPIAVAKRTYLAKCPYKCQKKAAAPAAAPAPIPLIDIGKAAARAPVEKKSSPVLPAAPAVAPAPPILLATPAVAPAPFFLDNPIHLSEILVKIVGKEMSCQGRLCEEHKICGKVLKEDVVVRLRKMQLMVEGKEEMTIAEIWVTVGLIAAMLALSLATW